MKCDFFDKLFNLSLSISYDRVLAISTGLANSICSHFERDGVVCPLEMQTGSFTTKYRPQSKLYNF